MSLNGNEIKKVATSETVLVENSTYIDGRFLVKSLGTDENREVFLCHTKTTGLPSRFHVKSTGTLDLNTAQLFNIRPYERSIRKVTPPTGEESTYADAANLVYLANSPGFSPISPWLTNTQIKGRLITEYNGQEDRRIGPHLEDGGKFTFSNTISWETNVEGNITSAPTLSSETFTFGVKRVDSDDTWDGLMGT